MRTFHRILLIDSLFGCALAAARLSYHRQIHPAGLVASAAVLALFLIGTLACLSIARHPVSIKFGVSQHRRLLDDIHELAERLPAVAMLGTVSGFAIALSASQDDLQQRATGASTALVATFVGIACWLVLGLQHRMLDRA